MPAGKRIGLGMKLKVCKDCKIEKSIGDFPLHRAKCKTCYGLQQSAAYKKNVVKRLARVKEYYRENREDKLLYAAQYRQENSEKIKSYKIEHKEEIALSWEVYYEKNKAILLANGHLYTKANPDKMNAKNARRRALKLQRTPQWLTKDDHEKIEEFYFYASLMTKTLGIQHDVDHIIPLKAKNISGLHCPENLQIITHKKNLKKGNKFPYTIQE